MCCVLSAPLPRRKMMKNFPQDAHLLDNEPLALFPCSDTPSFLHHRFPHGSCLTHHPGLPTNIEGLKVIEQVTGLALEGWCGTGNRRTVSSPSTQMLWFLEDAVTRKKQWDADREHVAQGSFLTLCLRPALCAQTLRSLVCHGTQKLCVPCFHHLFTVLVVCCWCNKFPQT